MSEHLNFTGPYLKVERAEHHIVELKSIFDLHIRANLKALTPKYNRPVRKSSTIGSKLPRHTPTVLGDALHNLRAALDHAYCIMVLDNGSTIDKNVKFPFHSRRIDGEGSVNGYAKSGKAPREDVIRFIFDEIQPFSGGRGEDLLKLHNLDIADKHMILLPTQQRTNVESLAFAEGGGISNVEFLMQGNTPAIICNALDDTANNKATFEILFGDGQPFSGEPILPMLRHLRDVVLETLQRLENFLR